MLVIPARVRVVVVMVSALALAAGLLTMALLSKPAQAQAQTFTDTDQTTFNQTFRSCTNELVQIQGTLHTVAHSTIDANGVIHSAFNFTLQGQGVSDSGAKYVFHSAFKQGYTFTADNSTYTFIQTEKLIRQGSDTPSDDLEYRILYHVTVNDQGEVTAVVDQGDRVCR
jgi:hypothetical protein